MNICTIIARNYVAHARVLAESFQKVHPGRRLQRPRHRRPGRLHRPRRGAVRAAHDRARSASADPERMAAAYDVMELSTAVKPWLLRHLLERQGVDSVAYLDPDIQVFDAARRGRAAGAEPRSGPDAALHGAAPPRRPQAERRGHPHRRLLQPRLHRPRAGDRRPRAARLVVGAPRERTASTNPSRGASSTSDGSTWPRVSGRASTSSATPPSTSPTGTCPTRSLETTAAGGYLVDGEPLRFFHFSGFDPRRPTELSKHQNRIDAAADPVLTRICREYAAELLSHGFEEAIGWPYGWEAMPGGVKLDRATRRVFREAAEAGSIPESVFTQPGAERFAEYLRGGESDGVNRYAKALWDSRADFRRIFPSVEGDSGPAFVDWLHATSGDTGVSTELLPPPPSSENGRPPEPSASPQAGDQRGRLPELRARSRGGGAPDPLGARGRRRPRDDDRLAHGARGDIRGPGRPRRRGVPVRLQPDLRQRGHAPRRRDGARPPLLRTPPLDRALVLGGLAFPRAGGASRSTTSTKSGLPPSTSPRRSAPSPRPMCTRSACRSPRRRRTRRAARSSGCRTGSASSSSSTTAASSAARTRSGSSRRSAGRSSRGRGPRW